MYLGAYVRVYGYVIEGVHNAPTVCCTQSCPAGKCAFLLKCNYHVFPIEQLANLNIYIPQKVLSGALCMLFTYL